MVEKHSFLKHGSSVPCGNLGWPFPYCQAEWIGEWRNKCPSLFLNHLLGLGFLTIALFLPNIKNADAYQPLRMGRHCSHQHWEEHLVPSGRERDWGNTMQKDCPLTVSSLVSSFSAAFFSPLLKMVSEDVSCRVSCSLSWPSRKELLKNISCLFLTDARVSSSCGYGRCCFLFSSSLKWVTTRNLNEIFVPHSHWLSVLLYILTSFSPCAVGIFPPTAS